YMIPMCIIDYYNPLIPGEIIQSYYIPDDIFDDMKSGKIVTYKVKYRDTLSAISKKYHTSALKIYELNNCIIDINLIFGGNVIFVHIDESLMDKYEPIIYLNAETEDGKIADDNEIQIENLNLPAVNECPDIIDIYYLNMAISFSFPCGYFRNRFEPALKYSISYSSNILNSEYIYYSTGFHYAEFKDSIGINTYEYSMKIPSVFLSLLYRHQFHEFEIISSASAGVNYMYVTFKVLNETESYFYPGCSINTGISRDITGTFNAGLSIGYDIIFSRPELFQSFNTGIFAEMEF
ncbi:MAG: LysM peptidoglycan-binding domain-containing protein, partial [Spirochaetes bacterium]|nr:LysM peptidoglycan-binding domain-containing protein [Spirochaetota bacterium]